MKWSHYWANNANTAMLISNLWFIAFWVTDEGLCIAAGFCWLGMFIFAAVRHAKVKDKEFRWVNPPEPCDKCGRSWEVE